MMLTHWMMSEELKLYKLSSEYSHTLLLRYKETVVYSHNCIKKPFWINISFQFSPFRQITKRLGIPPNAKIAGNNPPSASTIRNSKINADLNVLDQLVSSLLERQNQTATPPPSTSHTNDPSKLSRLRSLSFRSRRHSSHKGPSASVSSSNNELNLFASPANGFGQNANAMPTILESGSSGSGGPQSQPTTSSLDRHRTSSVRQILNTIKNAPHRLSQSMDGHQRLHDEESSNLTRNMLDWIRDMLAKNGR